VHHEHEESKNQRGITEKGVVTSMRPKKTKTDSEEASEENDVRKVREIQDVATEPSDEGQLHEEHQEAEGNEADTKSPDAVEHWQNLPRDDRRFVDQGVRRRRRRRPENDH
jgi:hypothetical protein